MPHYYFDTSALAKRYVPERGTSYVIDLIAASDARVTISALTVAEIASVIGARCRRGESTANERDMLYDTFLEDRDALDVVDLSDELLAEAARLALGDLRLRTLDAIQLASVQRWFDALSAHNIEPGPFVVADTRLIDAARTLGLTIENPEEHEQ